MALRFGRDAPRRSGVLEIVLAVRLRRQLRGAWLFGLAGPLSVVFGALVLLFPGLKARRDTPSKAIKERRW